MPRRHRAIEEFDDVENFLARVVEFGSGAKLKDAAGIRRDNCRCAGRPRILHFFRQDFERSFRLRDVVNPCGATAVVRELHFDKIYSWDGTN